MNRENIKRRLASRPFLKRLSVRLIRKYDNFKSKTKVTNDGYGKLLKDIRGEGNAIIIGKDTSYDPLLVYIRGNNNKLVIGENCQIGPYCKFIIIGENCSITVGDQTTMCHTIELNSRGENQKIIIGKDCMLSNNIIIRTSDDHPIYNNLTHERLNLPKDVVIGDHVWISPSSKVFKGVVIGNGVIVGSNTLVTKAVEDNTLVVGQPSKVVKRNVYWTREVVY